MGEYYKIVNLDKAEYLDPFRIPGSGAKLIEFGQEMMLGFTLLLAQNDGKLIEYEEETDLSFAEIVENIAKDEQEQIEGRWAGDRIVIIGDYDSSALYQRLKGTEYRDISSLIVSYFRRFDDQREEEELPASSEVLPGEYEKYPNDLIPPAPRPIEPLPEEVEANLFFEFDE